MSSKALTEDFKEVSVKLRGTTYKFKELSAGEYDGILAILGDGDDQDTSLLIRTMVVQSLTEPKLDAKQVAALPMPVYRKLANTVSSMSFDPIEEDADEEAPSPNA